MSKMKFTPEQFTEREPGNFLDYRDAHMVSEKAQALHDAWLDAQPVVYGYEDPTEHDITDWNTGESSDSQTHRARLVCIEEIEKKPCKHEPDIKEPNVASHVPSILRCKLCHVALKTKWEVVP
jgi:hypothetical protein